MKAKDIKKLVKKHHSEYECFIEFTSKEILKDFAKLYQSTLDTCLANGLTNKAEFDLLFVDIIFSYIVEGNFSNGTIGNLFLTAYQDEYLKIKVFKEIIPIENKLEPIDSEFNKMAKEWQSLAKSSEYVVTYNGFAVESIDIGDREYMVIHTVNASIDIDDYEKAKIKKLVKIKRTDLITVAIAICKNMQFHFESRFTIHDNTITGIRIREDVIEVWAGEHVYFISDVSKLNQIIRVI